LQRYQKEEKEYDDPPPVTAAAYTPPCPCVTNPTPPHFSGHSFSSFGSHFSGHSFSCFGSGGMFTPEITGSSNTGSVKLGSFNYLLSTCYCSTAHAAHRSTPCIAIYTYVLGGKKDKILPRTQDFSSSFPFLSSNVHTMVKYSNLMI